MSAPIRIAVDAMSGDFGPRVTIPAALAVAHSHPDVTLLLVGDQTRLETELAQQGASASRLSIVHAPDVVAMDADPRYALRHQKSSSLWQAVNLVRVGEADVCISAGNTGALMAISKYLLKTFPGIDRPAICKPMPVASGATYMLDLGANLVCSPEHLHQFALMGSVLAAASGVQQPKVALLNVGVEALKGTEIVRTADTLLRTDSRLNYVGFVEANELFRGDVDVVVCDGFSGNVALKASEGVARLIAHKVADGFRSAWYYRLMSLCLRPLLKRLQAELNPGTYNGAIFLGLHQSVVKSHGSAEVNDFVQALLVARDQARHSVAARIGAQFAMH